MTSGANNFPGLSRSWNFKEKNPGLSRRHGNPEKLFRLAYWKNKQLPAGLLISGLIPDVVGPCHISGLSNIWYIYTGNIFHSNTKKYNEIQLMPFSSKQAVMQPTYTKTCYIGLLQFKTLFQFQAIAYYMPNSGKDKKNTFFHVFTRRNMFNLISV